MRQSKYETNKSVNLNRHFERSEESQIVFLFEANPLPRDVSRCINMTAERNAPETAKSREVNSALAIVWARRIRLLIC